MSDLITLTTCSFVGTDVEDAAPSGGVLHPPYKAVPANDKNLNGWWYVTNGAFNQLAFKSKRGAKFTNKDIALAIAEKWNLLPAGTKIDIPPDPYVAPITQRWTDDQMTEYVRSRRYNFETRRWQ